MVCHKRNGNKICIECWEINNQVQSVSFSFNFYVITSLSLLSEGKRKTLMPKKLEILINMLERKLRLTDQKQFRKEQGKLIGDIQDSVTDGKTLPRNNKRG